MSSELERSVILLWFTKASFGMYIIYAEGIMASSQNLISCKCRVLIVHEKQVEDKVFFRKYINRRTNFTSRKYNSVPLTSIYEITAAVEYNFSNM